MIHLIMVILNWLEIVAVSGAAISLTIVLFYTQHQGKLYRIAFSAYIVLLLAWVFVLSVSMAPTTARPDDLVRPLAMVFYALVCLFRMRFFIDKARKEADEKTALSAQHIFEVTLFSLSLEKLQKYSLFGVGGVFLVGLLVARINRVEILQYTAIAANQQTKTVVAQANRRLDDVEKRIGDDTAVNNQLLSNQAILEQKVDKLSSQQRMPVSANKNRVNKTRKREPVNRLPNRSIVVPPISTTITPVPVPAEPEKKKRWYWPPDWFSARADSTETLLVDFKPY